MIGHEVDPLIRRLQQREESALAELYDRAARRAFGLAYHLLRDGGAAEDVVQAAFATVWEQADRLDASRGTAEAFLMTVTHRRAIDALRSTARRTAHVGDLASDPPDRAEPVLDALTRTERATEVREALEALPEAQRRVVQLAYFEGRTHHEIAALDGLPLGTVKSRMRLAIERLRGLLVAD
jgi:RNA polymerase sigma-70 factor (ECF subfamily)